MPQGKVPEASLHLREPRRHGRGQLGGRTPGGHHEFAAIPEEQGGPRPRILGQPEGPGPPGKLFLGLDKQIPPVVRVGSQILGGDNAAVQGAPGALRPQAGGFRIESEVDPLVRVLGLQGLARCQEQG